MAHRWSEEGWDQFFAAHPRQHDGRPTWTELRRLSRQLDHTPNAVLGVWEDAERYRRGVRYSLASPRLRIYLAARR
jgi:hypothetical protein